MRSCTLAERNAELFQRLSLGFVYRRSSKTLHPLGRFVTREMSAAGPQRGQNFTETVHHDNYPFIAKAHHAGRTLFITGASNGIGRATSLTFARSGAAVLILTAWYSLDN